jgi:hypothetical protein
MSQCAYECAGVIIIHRHPLDVLLSAMNYSKLKGIDKYFKNDEPKSVEEIIREGELDYYVDKFMENDGVDMYLGSSGSWFDFQRQWERVGQKVPYLRLQYEAFVENPQQGIEQIHEFLGVPYDPQKIRDIYEKAEARTALNGRFFWKKRAYNFSEMMPTSTITRFCLEYEEKLAYLGYRDFIGLDK